MKIDFPATNCRNGI